MTNRYYGGTSLGAGRTIQDFGLCDTTGAYIYTARTRQKGPVAFAFFAMGSPEALTVLKAIQQWTADIATAKWTPLAVATPTEALSERVDRNALTTFAESNSLTGITFLADHEGYQTRSWGISHLPTLLIVDGKTGQILYRMVGADTGELDAARGVLNNKVSAILAAEEAARRAEEEKKAQEAAAKA